MTTSLDKMIKQIPHYFILSSKEYANLVANKTVDKYTFYIIKDNNEIIFNNTSYGVSGAVYIDDSHPLPKVGNPSIFYIDQDYEVYIWNGKKYQTIILPLGIGTVSAANTQNKVTGESIENYAAKTIVKIINSLSDLSYDPDTTEATVRDSKNAVVKTFRINNIVAKLDFNGSTGLFSIYGWENVVAGSPQVNPTKLLKQFTIDIATKALYSAKYNKDTKSIDLTLSDNSVIHIDVSSMASQDFYTKGKTINVRIEKSNNSLVCKVYLDVKLHQPLANEKPNRISILSDGLYAVRDDGNLAKNPFAKYDNIYTANIHGDLADSKFAIKDSKELLDNINDTVIPESAITNTVNKDDYLQSGQMTFATAKDLLSGYTVNRMITDHYFGKTLIYINKAQYDWMKTVKDNPNDPLEKSIYDSVNNALIPNDTHKTMTKDGVVYEQIVMPDSTYKDYASKNLVNNNSVYDITKATNSNGDSSIYYNIKKPVEDKYNVKVIYVNQAQFNWMKTFKVASTDKDTSKVLLYNSVSKAIVPYDQKSAMLYNDVTYEKIQIPMSDYKTYVANHYLANANIYDITNDTNNNEYYTIKKAVYDKYNIQSSSQSGSSDDSIIGVVIKDYNADPSHAWARVDGKTWEYI